MSRDPKVTLLDHKRKVKKQDLTDSEKIVFAYHYFEGGNDSEAIALLGSVEQHYYLVGIYKDLARALLCHITYKTTGNRAHGKESEFYLVVYRLTKKIVSNNMSFQKSGYFFELRNTLFKDFQL